MEEPVRSLPRWLAGAVQALELRNDPVVRLDELYGVFSEIPRRDARHAVAELVQRGWLRPTGVRGTYEFIPGAAAGPYPSGDPWVPLRAALLLRPEALHVGATSAAWLRGYAQRPPDRHTVVAHSGTHVPAGIRAAYRVLEMTPAPAGDIIDGLSVPTAAELFAELAQLAPRLRLDAAQGWIRRLLADTAPHDLTGALRYRSQATRARAGYIAEASGAVSHAAAIAELGLPKSGPFYTGTQRPDPHYSARWRVYDSGHIIS